MIQTLKESTQTKLEKGRHPSLQVVRINRLLGDIDTVEISDGNTKRTFSLKEIRQMMAAGCKIKGLSYQNGIVKEHTCGRKYHKKEINLAYLTRLHKEMTRLEDNPNRSEKSEKKMKMLQKRWNKLRDNPDYEQLFAKWENARDS